MTDTVKTEVVNDVFYIELNRPMVHHAFNEDMIANLTKTFTSINDLKTVRAAVISSQGPHFCAGADINYMQQMADLNESENYADAKALAHLFESLSTVKVPTIAKIQGSALGGGVGIAAACDITIAETNAVFSLSEPKLGIIPAVISPYIINSIGIKNARYWMFTAKKVSGQEAYNAGLVQELVDRKNLDSKAEEIISQIKQLGPVALETIKGLVNTIQNNSVDNLPEHLCKLIAAVRTSPEGRHGLKSFLNKTKPRW